jgi:hypothetical protein
LAALFLWGIRTHGKHCTISLPHVGNLPVSLAIRSSRHEAFHLVRFTYQDPLTALAIELSGDTENKLLPQTNIYDALTRAQLLAPIPRGLTFAAFAGHIAGGPIPNAKIAAAIWKDGSTFGSNDILNQLLKSRRATLSTFDHVLSILQSGLDGGWTSAQYQNALEVAQPPNLVLNTMDQARTQFAADAVYYDAKLMFCSEADAQKPTRSVRTLQRMLKRQRDQLADSAPVLSGNAPAGQK